MVVDTDQHQVTVSRYHLQLAGITQQRTLVELSERQTVHRLTQFTHPHVIAVRDRLLHADVAVQLENVELVVAGRTSCFQQVA